MVLQGDGGGQVDSRCDGVVGVEGRVEDALVEGCKGRLGGGGILVEAGTFPLGALCNVPHKCVAQCFRTLL